MPADAGIKFGSYVLLRRIARGGMAEVFLAQQRGLEGFDRRVAVKRILPHLADSPDFVKMFFGEAKLAAQLGHPNIVHIYEFGKVEQDYFIAMEYVDGVHAGQLWKHGELHEKLPPTLVARIGADAATALHYAQELRNAAGKPLGLVHRDVSPANIMISYDGVVKLCDFGIAKAAAATDQLTSPGQVKGKYAYMSPEQTVAQPLDGRSDVFSLAIVMWELLTGKFIVPRGDAVAAMRMIRDGKLEPIAQALPSCPRPLAKAITWALESQREKRATAADLAQALEAFIKSAPELATSMQLGNWIRQRFPREHTGQHAAIQPGGTQIAPGTVAASTDASQLAITPQPAHDPGTEIREATPFDEGETSTNKMRPYGEGAPIFARPTAQQHAEQPFASGAITIKQPPPGASGDSTVIDDPLTPKSRAAADEETVLAGARKLVVPADAEPSDARETIVMDNAPRVDRASSGDNSPRVSMPARALQISAPHAPRDGSSPFPRVGDSEPRARVGDQSGPRPRIDQSAPLPRVELGSRRSMAWLTPWRAVRAGVDRKRSQRLRLVVTFGALFGLALISFSIALCATGSKKSVAPDATALVAFDGAPAPGDAAALAVAQPADAPPAPTFPPDANEEAYLEVSTIPDGGKVIAGDQVRTAPAQLVVSAGSFDVSAELAGYLAETRHVTIERGEHQKIEIAFTRKTSTRPPIAQTGKLSVRTSPYAEMYENGKKIAETPFADRDMPVGTHTLVFKNPQHPQVTKRVTISAGKPTRLNFNLPD